MKVNVISLMPEMVEEALRYGVVGGAFKRGQCFLHTLNPRQFTEDNHQTVDDRSFGGGDGMLMLAEPLQKTLNHLMPAGPVFYLSPHGRVLDEPLVKRLSAAQELTFICGRYGGVDERFLQKNNILELSIGNFVLSGGEPAAIVAIDSIVRKIPGVLGHQASAHFDSFANGLLEVPHFTRPQLWEGMVVPPILLSGDHQKISQYKEIMGVVVTLLKRPELLKGKKWPWGDIAEYVKSLHENDVMPLGFQLNEILQKIVEVERG